MDNREIEKILLSNPLTRSNFAGVFAIDTIETPKKFPSSAVINCAPHYSPGNHWISVYTNSHGKSTFFDSLADKIPPQIKEHFFIVETLKKPIQRLFSTTCGELCILFIFLKSKHYSLSEIYDTLISKSDVSIRKLARSINNL